MAFNLGGGFGSTNTAERKTGTLFGSTTAPPGGLFGQTQQQNAPAQNAFGASSNPAQTGSTLFGNTNPNPASGSTLFGSSQQQQPQQQQSQFNNSIFGGKLQPAPSLHPLQAQQLQQSQYGLPQLRQSTASQLASTLVNGQSEFIPAAPLVFYPFLICKLQGEKSIQQQVTVINDKWDPTNPDCAFQFYFYNQVKPEEAPFYGPQPHEDERKWEEALSKKPNPGAIPVLARGFEEIAARIHYQNLAVAGLQTRLHEINNSLKLMKSTHELEIASRISEAKRRHIVSTQRTLALASKVQILRNRGYAMDQAEEELKKKLVELERKTFDPVLGGRQEEIWARMSGVRERARRLQEETEKLGKQIQNQQEGAVFSDEDQQQIDRVGGIPLLGAGRRVLTCARYWEISISSSSILRSRLMTPRMNTNSGRNRDNLRGLLDNWRRRGLCMIIRNRRRDVSGLFWYFLDTTAPQP
jgi:nuclear pore complex protein Nup54